MRVGDFRVLSKKENEFGVTDVSFEFSISEPTVANMRLLMCVDVTDTDSTKVFPVDCAFDQETRDGTTFITVVITDFAFSQDLTVDEIANFSVLKVVGQDAEGKDFSFSIPVFCSLDEKVVRIELMSPF